MVPNIASLELITSIMKDFFLSRNLVLSTQKGPQTEIKLTEMAALYFTVLPVEPLSKNSSICPAAKEIKEEMKFCLKLA